MRATQIKFLPLLITILFTLGCSGTVEFGFNVHSTTHKVVNEVHFDREMLVSTGSPFLDNGEVYPVIITSAHDWATNFPGGRVKNTLRYHQEEGETCNQTHSEGNSPGDWTIVECFDRSDTDRGKLFSSVDDGSFWYWRSDELMRRHYYRWKPNTRTRYLHKFKPRKRRGERWATNGMVYME